MNYLYKVFTGTGDYRQLMYVTSSLHAASKFVEKYNKQFSISDFDTYESMSAYMETAFDYVPNIPDHYTGKTYHIYVLCADEDFNITNSNGKANVWGYPLSEFVDPSGCGFDMLSPCIGDHFEQNLQFLFDNGHVIVHDPYMFDGKGGYHIMISFPDTENDYSQTVYTRCDENNIYGKNIIEDSLVDWFEAEANNLLNKLRY